jgi:hypothetical protein
MAPGSSPLSSTSAQPRSGAWSLAVGVAQRVGELVAPGPGVDRYEHAARDRGRDHGLDELGVVAHQQAEAVARLHASGDQTGGDAVAVLEQVAVGPDLVVANAASLERQNVEVGLALGVRGDQIGQDQVVAFAHGWLLTLLRRG